VRIKRLVTIKRYSQQNYEWLARGNCQEIARIKTVMSVLRIQKYKATSIVVDKYGLFEKPSGSWHLIDAEAKRYILPQTGWAVRELNHKSSDVVYKERED